MNAGITGSSECVTQELEHYSPVLGECKNCRRDVARGSVNDGANVGG